MTAQSGEASSRESQHGGLCRRKRSGLGAAWGAGGTTLAGLGVVEQEAQPPGPWAAQTWTQSWFQASPGPVPQPAQ